MGGGIVLGEGFLLAIVVGAVPHDVEIVPLRMFAWLEIRLVISTEEMVSRVRHR